MSLSVGSHTDGGLIAPISLLGGVASLLLLGCGPNAPGEDEASAATLDRDIFTSGCAFTSCHGGDTPAAGLTFSRGLCAAMLERPSCLFPGKTLAVPGEPARSFLLDKLMGTGLAPQPETSCAVSNFRMPIGAKPLSDQQIDRVRAWIVAGSPCGGDGGRPGGGHEGGPDGGGNTLIPDGGGNDRSGADSGLGGGPVVLTLSPPSLRLPAGGRATVTLGMSPPAGPEGASVTIDASERETLAVPSVVFLAAGGSEVQFEVLGRKPAASLRMMASLPGVRAEITVSIDGLFVGEVFYGGLDESPDADGLRSQWVKLINASVVPIDLSGYVLGAGRRGFDETVTELTGFLEPGGCHVVGGPGSSPDNGSPSYDQVHDFAPDLPRPGVDLPGAKLGLFAAAVLAAGGPALAASALEAAPEGLAIAPGASLARDSLTGWSARVVPTPASCPVLR